LQLGEVLGRRLGSEQAVTHCVKRMIDLPGWHPDDGSDSIHSGEDLLDAD